jgi:NAD-dependent SIR2 family protein deacetylase
MRKQPIMPKFACFHCRKVFRKPYLPTGEQRQDARGRWYPVMKPPTCPDCGESMIDMGRYFKPPKRTNVQQWEKVRQLRQNGVIFNGYAGRIPKRLSQVKPYLANRERRREKSEGERLLERFNQADDAR